MQASIALHLTIGIGNEWLPVRKQDAWNLRALCDAFGDSAPLMTRTLDDIKTAGQFAHWRRVAKRLGFDVKVLSASQIIGPVPALDTMSFADLCDYWKTACDRKTALADLSGVHGYCRRELYWLMAFAGARMDRLEAEQGNDSNTMHASTLRMIEALEQIGPNFRFGPKRAQRRRQEVCAV
jgi:hypothetical protein